MITLENPPALILLIIIPLLYLLRKLNIFTGISFPMTLSDWNGKNFSWNNKFRNILSSIIQILCICGFICGVIAFANPIIRHQKKVYLSRGTDLLFVIDVSPSMAGKDIAGMNRLEASKKVIHSIIEKSDGETLGLIEMGRDAAVIVPMTLDRNNFFARLDNLAIGELGDGTAIGTGLSCAVYHLSDSNAPKKCIILITDGENNAGSIHPYTAARLAASKGISLYVLGIGTKGTIPLEYVDPKTGRVYSGFLDSNYNEEALSRIAGEGNGKFFCIETMSELTLSLNTISNKLRTAQTYRVVNSDENLYSYFLIIAALLVCLAWFLRRVVLKEML